MPRVGPTKQAFSMTSLLGDMLSQTSDVIKELAWYPEIVARHIAANKKHQAAQVRFQQRAALEIESLTKESS